MRILILEDEAIIAESLFQLLKLLEYDPLEPVDNPDDAISIIETMQIDLIVLDIRLKNQRSGLEVAAYLNQQKRNIPYLILSAHSDVETILQAKKYAPAAYLVKPFVRESLFAAIELAIPYEKEVAVSAHEVFLKTGTKHEKVDLQSLMYLKASGKYTELHFTFGKRLIRMPLSTYIRVQESIQFLRIHKTYAVNPDYIKSFTADELTIDNTRLPVGRFFMPEVNKFLRTRISNK